MTYSVAEAIPVATTIFQQDQSLAFTVNHWDTPYSPLENDVASGGIIMDVREPLGDGTYTLKTNLAAASASNAYTTFTNSSYSKSVVASGRTDNLIGYWAGGAPGRHGASVRRRVAYHFRCYLRPVNGREWWSASAAPNFQIAYAGNGYVRITKTVSGVTTDVTKGAVAINGAMTEADYLANGLPLSDAISTMNADDYLDIYYIQDNESWGGFVFKAVLSGATAADSPVITSSLFDDGSRPSMNVFQSIAAMEVERNIGAASTAKITVPLLNASISDDFGWEYVKSASDDPGFLRYHQGDGTSFDVKRGRLIRIKSGFINEEYTTFTGYIDGFDPPSDGRMQMRCVTFEQRLVDQHIKNYPDRISYMCFDYKKRKGTSEPVYDTTAYDNWAIEYALRDIFVRAGLDESITRQPLQVTTSTGTLQAVTMVSETFLKFRARTAPIHYEGGSDVASKQLRLDRPVHYGNAGAGFDDTKPADDAYLFKPENTQDMWSFVRAVSDRYGYNCWLDAFGHCVLSPSNNAHAVWDFDTSFGSTPTANTNPSAYAGTYMEWTGTPGPITKSVTAARIDLIIPRGVSHGSWTYTVKNALGITVSSGTLNPSLPAGSADEFFYDYHLTPTGVNSTVVTLYSGDYGTYSVTLDSTGGAATRRLDSFLLWHTDPLKPRYTNAFSSQINATAIEASDAMNDMRNYVIVVGRRKAAVTDSAKFAESRNLNPENADAEFISVSAVDVASITDPTAVNFIGYSKESIIYDKNISDEDFASYISNTFIYRYHLPKPAGSVNHTLIPVLTLREPVYAVDTKFNTLDAQAVLWISQIKHIWTEKSALTQFVASSYAPIPAYAPREDIDIDTYFGGNPVSNVKVSYRTLNNNAGYGAGIDAVNMAPAVEYMSDANDVKLYTSISITGGSPEYLDMQTGKDWPPVPGSVFIRPATGAATAGTAQVTQWTDTTLAYKGSSKSVRLDGLQALTSVIADLNLQIPNQYGGYTTQVVSNLTLDQDATKEWYYTYDTAFQTVTVYHNTTALPPLLQNPLRITADFTVNWYQTLGFSSANQWIADSPLFHFMNVDYRTGASQKRIYLPWKGGDGSSGYVRNTGVTSYDVTYRRLGPVDGSNNFSDPYGGASPYYDPYTGELGYVVAVQFDALVSGMYRISVRSVYDDTVVAWLTEPTEDKEDEEYHWSYFGAGASKKLYWDGVDNLGFWNRRQSESYAAAAHGAFEQDEQPVIGKGFYVWNREEDRSNAFPPISLISGSLDSVTGKPIFGQGTFAKWYVKFEAINDTLQAIADANQGTGGAGSLSLNVPRVTDSDNLSADYNTDAIKVTGTASSGGASTMTDSGKSWGTNQWKSCVLEITSGTGAGQSKQIISNTNTVITIVGTWSTQPNGTSGYRIVSPSALIYTHLPEPTKVELHSIADYINASAYDETSPPTSDAGNWQTTPNTDAVINNQKPVRMRFNTMLRPGTLWTGNQDFIPFKLTRVAHLMATFFDQVIVNEGVIYPNTSTIKRTIYNRAFQNTEHTLLIADEDWRYQPSLKQTTAGTGYEWVFLPRHFKKNFRGVPDESLQFGDYLQLEEVPKWGNGRQISGPRSRLNIAFMNYLFYLSAYIQDKSGRYSWCINRSFLDRSKIIKNAFADWYDPSSTATPRAAASSSTYRNEWPDDLDTQHRRTVLTRQWSDEGTWRADQNTLWNFGGAGSVGYELLRHKWKDHYPASGAGTLNGTNWSSLTGGLQVDQHSKWHRDGRSQLPSDFGSPNLTRQLGNDSYTSGGTALGDWLWEDDPEWVPCVSRDFHGYYLLPPMVDKDGTIDYHSDYIYGIVDSRDYDSTYNDGNDTAMAPVWNSPVYDMNETYGSGSGALVRFWPNRIVDPKAGPTKNNVNANTCDYVRQKELIHYEELRGWFSRGPRPQEQPKRVTPGLPYYVNLYSYDAIDYDRARKNHAYPLYRASPTSAGWWDIRFRYEYLWESGTLYPTNFIGVPDFRGMNPFISQVFPYTFLSALKYDDGAWAGWKDDYSTTGTGDAAYKLYFAGIRSSVDVFAQGYMPVAVGPQLREAAANTVLSTDMIFHMTLVNSRRNRVI